MAAPFSLKCQNCDAPLAADEAFCGKCGQKIGPVRLALRDIGHDLLHALVHVDRSVLSLIRALVVRPGRVAREYVAGRRKRYFGPFAFLVVAVGLSSAAAAWSGFSAVSAYESRASRVEDFLNHHINLVTLLQVPVLAAICLLLYRKERLNYAEHLVLASYASGMRSIVFALVLAPDLYFFGSGHSWLPFLYLYYALWLGYFGFAAAQFYSGNRALAWLKGALVAALAQIVTAGVLSAAASIYLQIAAR